MANEIKGITPARRLPPGWVEMTHAGVEGTHRVAPTAVAHWEARGWKPKSDDSATAPAAGETTSKPATPAPRGGAATGQES